MAFRARRPAATTAAQYSVSMTEPPSPTASDAPPAAQAVVDLIGALGYGSLRGFSRMAVDAELAPALPTKAAIARMAVTEFQHFETLTARLDRLGVSHDDAMAPFVAAIDSFHERTHPSDWLEGLVKAYVSDGIARDFYSEIARYVDSETREFVTRVLADEGQEQIVLDAVRPVIDSDPRTASRLALWGRRLVGEAIQQAQQVAVARESLTALLVGGWGSGADIAELGQIFARITEAHSERMTRLGLSA